VSWIQTQNQYYWYGKKALEAWLFSKQTDVTWSSLIDGLGLGSPSTVDSYICFALVMDKLKEFDNGSMCMVAEFFEKSSKESITAFGSKTKIQGLSAGWVHKILENCLYAKDLLLWEKVLKPRVVEEIKKYPEQKYLEEQEELEPVVEELEPIVEEEDTEIQAFIDDLKKLPHYKQYLNTLRNDLKRKLREVTEPRKKLKGILKNVT